MELKGELLKLAIEDLPCSFLSVKKARKRVEKHGKSRQATKYLQYV